MSDIAHHLGGALRAKNQVLFNLMHHEAVICRSEGLPLRIVDRTPPFRLEALLKIYFASTQRALPGQEQRAGPRALFAADSLTVAINSPKPLLPVYATGSWAEGVYFTWGRRRGCQWKGPGERRPW